MTENERVRYLRETVLPDREGHKISQDLFVDGLGIKKSALSLIESGRNSLTDSVRILICNKYGVREEWLRDGVGEIFVKKSAEDELNALAEKVMTDTPDSFRRRFISMLAKLTDEQWKMLSEMEDMMLASKSDVPSGDSDRESAEQLRADLDREIALQKKQEEKSTGSGSTPKSRTPGNGAEESAG